MFLIHFSHYLQVIKLEIATVPLGPVKQMHFRKLEPDINSHQSRVGWTQSGGAEIHTICERRKPLSTLSSFTSVSILPSLRGLDVIVFNWSLNLGAVRLRFQVLRNSESFLELGRKVLPTHPCSVRRDLRAS